MINEEMQAVFRRIGIGRRYEEWFITDYACPDAYIGKVFGEYESLSDLNYLAGQIMEMRESGEFWHAVLDLGENGGSVRKLINLTENMAALIICPECSMIMTSVIFGSRKAAAMIRINSVRWQTISTMRASDGMFAWKKAAYSATTDMYGQTEDASWTYTTATPRTSPKNIGSVLQRSRPVPHRRGRPSSPNDKICTFDIALRFEYSTIKTIKKCTP